MCHVLEENPSQFKNQVFVISLLEKYNNTLQYSKKSIEKTINKCLTVVCSSCTESMFSFAGQLVFKKINMAT